MRSIIFGCAAVQIRRTALRQMWSVVGGQVFIFRECKEELVVQSLICNLMKIIHKMCAHISASEVIALFFPFLIDLFTFTTTCFHIVGRNVKTSA